jgi:hypothetical protein
LGLFSTLSASFPERHASAPAAGAEAANTIKSLIGSHRLLYLVQASSHAIQLCSMPRIIYSCIHYRSMGIKFPHLTNLLVVRVEVLARSGLSLSDHPLGFDSPVLLE